MHTLIHKLYTLYTCLYYIHSNIHILIIYCTYTIYYRYPKIFHVFNIVEHGRRWYRSMIFSSNSKLCLYTMPEEVIIINNETYMTSGDVYKIHNNNYSLIISRDITTTTTTSTNTNNDNNNTTNSVKQTYLPHRYIRGIVPSVLLKMYKFWQNNDDDSIIGYMPITTINKTIQRSILYLKLNNNIKNKDSYIYKSKNNIICHITRVYIHEDNTTNTNTAEKEKDTPHVGIEPSTPAPGKSATSTTTTDNTSAEYNTTPDLSKPKLYLINLLSVLSTFGTSHGLYKQTGVRMNDIYDTFDQEYNTIHALVRMLLRLDTLANCIAWSKTDPTTTSTATSTASNSMISIDLIELPRLRLTFEKRIDPTTGALNYYCIEQSGLYLTGYDETLKFSSLIHSIPNLILLKNNDHEYYALLSALAKPTSMKRKGAKNTYHISFLTSDETWNENTYDIPYFVYPIHHTSSFLSSRSIAASLYLLVIRLMTRRYEEAFRLIENCVTDVRFTPQEGQNYDPLYYIVYDVYCLY